MGGGRVEIKVRNGVYEKFKIPTIELGLSGSRECEDPTR